MVQNISLFIFFMVVGFLLRSYVLLKNRWAGIDSFLHLYAAKKLKIHGLKPFIFEEFYTSEKFIHPPLFHVFLSFFGENQHRKLQFSGPMFDLIVGALLYYFCMNFFSSDVAVLAAMVFFISPILLEQSFSVSPRSMANLFLTLSFFLLFLFFKSNQTIFFLFAILFSSLVFLTHKQTIQSLVFSSIFLAVGLKSIFPVVLIAIGFILAVISTKGWYLSLAKVHISTTLYFIRGGAVMDNRRLLFEYIRMIFNFPFVIFVPTLYFIDYNFDNYFFLLWGGSLLILSMTWVWGEGFRHLANGVVPLSILFSIAVIEVPNTKIIFILLALISIAFFILKNYKMNNDQVLVKSDELLNGFNVIKKRSKPNDVFVTVPLNLMFAGIYFTGRRGLIGTGWTSEGLNFFERLRSYVRHGTIEEMLKEFNVKWILIQGRLGKEIPGKKVFKKGDVEVFEIY